MTNTLPWTQGITPLMLAPMQGLTNMALRNLFLEKYSPDVVFTEFLRVRPGSKKSLSDVDCSEVSSHSGPGTLVVQLIGRHAADLVAAAHKAQELGALHININMGCPFGRMNSNSSGGVLMKNPVEIPDLLAGLRKEVHGSLSVKLRAGYDNSRQIFELLPVFEDEGVDFLVIHPRTVVQKYSGWADHEITAETVAKTTIPVIANGDIKTASQARALLLKTRAAGLMMGRGAIGDPSLFQRIRGELPEENGIEERQREVYLYITELLYRYQNLFHGDTQVLNKIKTVTTYIDDPQLKARIKKLQRATTLKNFTSSLAALIAPE